MNSELGWLFLLLSEREREGKEEKREEEKRTDRHHHALTPPKSSKHQALHILFKMAPRNESEGNSASSSGGMKRSESESSFVSVPEDGPIKDYRDYRVRKSSLIA